MPPLSSRVLSCLGTHEALVRAQTAEARGEATVSVAAIAALARAMTARDALTHQHSQRVRRYAAALAGEACIVSGEMLEAIDGAALLHDIGKLGIPDRLLDKPGPLTRDEYDQVKQHVIIGADILAALCVQAPIALIVRHHHEKWDGTGYPDGLQGEEIPIGARVLAIADGYDALTSDRPYRRELSHEAAVELIQQGRGTMYDPIIADVFLRIAHGVRAACARERADKSPARTLGPWLRRVRPV